MQCSFLKGSCMTFCTANGEVYIPSLFELDEYCKSGRHKMCPFYCTTENDGKAAITSDAGKSAARW